MKAEFTMCWKGEKEEDDDDEGGVSSCAFKAVCVDPTLDYLRSFSFNKEGNDKIGEDGSFIERMKAKPWFELLYSKPYSFLFEEVSIDVTCNGGAFLTKRSSVTRDSAGKQGYKQGYKHGVK